MKQKVSGQFKSWNGVNNFLILRSITDTALKNRYEVQVSFIAMILLIITIIGTYAQFTLVVIPDTQKLSSDEEFGDPAQPDLLFDRMKAMARWIADHRDSLNIVMVAHLGDMTEDQNVPITSAGESLTRRALFPPCFAIIPSGPMKIRYMPIPLT